MRLAWVRVVPKAMRGWALATVLCAVTIGLVVGYRSADAGEQLQTIALDGLAGLLVGAVLGAWMLALGFVFADARRRGMRPVLWVLVAALFPHLLGFLLYFVLRPPLALACSQCGGFVAEGQRYCPRCGAQQAQGQASAGSAAVSPGEVDL